MDQTSYGFYYVWEGVGELQAVAMDVQLQAVSFGWGNYPAAANI